MSVSTSRPIPFANAPTEAGSVPRVVATLERLRAKHLTTWLPGYAISRLRQAFERRGPPRELFVAVCDHFEPGWRGADRHTALSRALRWREGYPKLAAPYRDASGRPPRHTFFVPMEEIGDPELDVLEPLVEAGLGELEVHLHHHGDDARSLREKLEGYVTRLADRGHLSRAPDGRPRYAFIHGNWALANPHPDGRHCGVDDELRVLFQTGCYADLTFPAYPDAAQSRRVNALWWPDVVGRTRRAHDHGERARVGTFMHDRVFMVAGPLALARRDGAAALRVDYGALTAHDPATRSRVDAWVRVAPSVVGRPEWAFVKLHTHGAPEAQAESLLGDGGHALHRSLAELVANGATRLHYVTARELYNVACAAMMGRPERPEALRDSVLGPPPRATRHGT